jgi:spore maturation protein CgeB
MSNQAILFIGRDSGTSRHRASAFRRLGYDVFVIDPFSFFPNNRFIGLWTWHTGSLFLEDFVRRSVLSNLPHKKFDLVYVDGGELIGPSLVLDLQRRFGPVINYNIDDPFSPRDGRRWRLYLRAVPLYDLVVVVRNSNVSEAFSAGAREVLRVHMSADEVAHSPRRISEQDQRKWASEVLFAGTWMPERGPFMARLIDLGIPLSIYGCRWQKAPEWSVLRSFWRGPGLYEDNEYARAIQCAKVNLGLLSKGNRDLSTTRSFEIPCLGAVLCAERTSEHSQLYKENKEAVFWSDPEECAWRCTELLKEEELRKSIGICARGRCLQNGTMNENILGQILNRIPHPKSSQESRHRAPRALLRNTTHSIPGRESDGSLESKWQISRSKL